MLKTNYHCHTTFCDGSNTVEEMVCAAVEKNFDILGISSHSAYPFAEKCHISPHEHKKYIQTVKNATEKYKDKITVLCGFEADYIKGISKPSLTEDYAELKPDYLIGSVHYVVINDKIFAVDDSAENLAVSIRDSCGGKAEIAVKEYFALEREMLSKGGFTILGHADLIRKNNGKLCMFNEKDEWYRNEIKTLADCIKRAGVIAEINTGAISRGTMDDIYPSEELLHLLHERNIPITVNSDAHSCSALDCAFERAFFKAKKAGYSELAYLDSGSNIKFQKLDFNSI